MCFPHIDLLGNSIFDYKSCDFFYPGTLDFRGDMQSTSLSVQINFSEFYVAALTCSAWPNETGRCLK